MDDFFVKAELLTKQYPGEKRGSEPLVVFDDVCFGIKKGEFISCIGHSGCGKSTILNILAGLAKPSAGAVVMRGNEISGPSINRAVVFQNHSLLPWLSALQNVMFAVRSKWPEWKKPEVREHSLKYLKLVGLDQTYDRKPYQLSGGMRQRVGIARAFAIKSDLLLLDEPFGALDALTRGVIQDELIKIWSETKQTVFMITHDVDEAILLSDKIFLMTNGPHASIAESVFIDIPRPRNRAEIVHHPHYYKIRNHLVDFLVSRSHMIAESQQSGKTGRFELPCEVNPTIEP